MIFELSPFRPVRLMLASLGLLAAGLLALPGHAAAAAYVPGKVLVSYRPAPGPAPVPELGRDLALRMGIRAAAAPGPRLVDLPRGVSVNEALRALRRLPDVAWAVPDYLAHAAGSAWIPNDRGRSHHARGWEKLQWNFLPGAGVNAPGAWENLIADRHPGGRGVVVAVLDTGIAYRNWRSFRRSPDFNRTRFVDPYDFVAHNRYPLDREGHGTFVAGTIAESTNNRIGLTGLAFGASIMPVRVLNAGGSGDAATIARGIRYAVHHHARVINLSLEFPPDVTAGDIPDVMSAIRYAIRHRVTVVAASGNESIDQIDYPARAPSVISVGATTSDRCLADYSNGGSSLTLVAPGGGQDTSLLDDPDCHPGRRLPPIYQTTFQPGNPRHFSIPGGIFGTSMSAPHVAAVAAMIIASGILGRHPSPQQIRHRLEMTAEPLGGSHPNQNYGWGLLNAAAATAPITATVQR